jgi:hypothetical protein
MGGGVFDADVREEDRTAHLTILLTKVAQVSGDWLDRHGISPPRDLFVLAQEGWYARSVNTLDGHRISHSNSGAAKPAPRRRSARVSRPCQAMQPSVTRSCLRTSARLPSSGCSFQMLEQQAAKGEATNELSLPIDRSDRAEYLGVPLRTKQGFRALTTQASCKAETDGMEGYRSRCIR